MKEADKCIDTKESYSLEDAISNLSKFPKVKFDETVELHLHLNVNPKNSDQVVRGTVVLPHGTGKKVKIAVFCKGPQAQKAKEAGADYIGAEDLIEKVAKGFLDFDRVIAMPDMMRDLSKLGKILGPRGLMPSPKIGTVTKDIEKAINEVKSGKVGFKSDKQGGIHLGIGKRSFPGDHLLRNAVQVIDAVNHLKPVAVKGNLIKSLVLTTTMGPGIKVRL